MNTVWLGDIALELPAWPTSMERRQGHNYAEHQPVNRPPLLQSTGRNLIEYTFEGRLHRQFGRTPAQDLALLRAVVAESKALPLVFGNGEYPGKFVVADMSERTESTGADGDPDAVTVTLSLREYVENDKLAAPIRSQFDFAKGLRRQVAEGLRKWLG
jgi:phage protein U